VSDKGVNGKVSERLEKGWRYLCDIRIVGFSPRNSSNLI